MDGAGRGSVDDCCKQENTHRGDTMMDANRDNGDSMQQTFFTGYHSNGCSAHSGNTLPVVAVLDDDCDGDYHSDSDSGDEPINESIHVSSPDDYTAFCYGDFFTITCRFPEEELIFSWEDQPASSGDTSDGVSVPPMKRKKKAKQQTESHDDVLGPLQGSPASTKTSKRRIRNKESSHINELSFPSIHQLGGENEDAKVSGGKSKKRGSSKVNTSMQQTELPAAELVSSPPCEQSAHTDETSVSACKSKKKDVIRVNKSEEPMESPTRNGRGRDKDGCDIDKLVVSHNTPVSRSRSKKRGSSRVNRSRSTKRGSSRKRESSKVNKSKQPTESSELVIVSSPITCEPNADTDDTSLSTSKCKKKKRGRSMVNKSMKAKESPARTRRGGKRDNRPLEEPVFPSIHTDGDGENDNTTASRNRSSSKKRGSSRLTKLKQPIASPTTSTKMKRAIRPPEELAFSPIQDDDDVSSLTNGRKKKSSRANKSKQQTESPKMKKGIKKTVEPPSLHFSDGEDPATVDNVSNLNIESPPSLLNATITINSPKQDSMEGAKANTVSKELTNYFPCESTLTSLTDDVSFCDDTESDKESTVGGRRSTSLVIISIPEGDNEVASPSKTRIRSARKDFDERQYRESLKISLHKAVKDAASIGQLTKLVEGVVEAMGCTDDETTSTNGHGSKKDDWKLKTAEAMQKDLSRSNHFQVINEAASMGQLRKLRSERVISIPEDEASDAVRHEVGAKSDSISYIRKRRQMLRDASTKLDRYIENSTKEKRKTMFDPEFVLERKEHLERIQDRFTNGEIDWLPTLEVPTFKSPRVFLSRARLRASMAKEAAKAAEARTNRLVSNVRLMVTNGCSCVYCKNPTPFQTQAYQCVRERNISMSGSPSTVVPSPRRGMSMSAHSSHIDQVTLLEQYTTVLKKARSLIPTNGQGNGDIEASYPSSQFRQSSSQIRQPSSTAPRRSHSSPEVAIVSNSAPVWATTNLRKTAGDPRKVTKERRKDNTPVWVLITGERDHSLPEWASPALREMLGYDTPRDENDNIDHSDDSAKEMTSIHEASLCSSKLDDRIGVVIAPSPTSVVISKRVPIDP